MVEIPRKFTWNYFWSEMRSRFEDFANTHLHLQNMVEYLSQWSKNARENCGLVMSKNTNIDKTYIRYSSWIWLLFLLLLLLLFFFFFTLTGTWKKPLLIYSTRHDLNMCISQCLEISFLFFLLLILTLCIFTLLQLTCSYMFWIKHFWLTFFKTVWLTPPPPPHPNVSGQHKS